jgi:tRNA pseudouridine13 synthase
LLLERFQQGFDTALGKPDVNASIRSEAAHFQVEEELGFEPCGEGEHCFLLIQKTGENTEAVARKLARFASVPAKMVSYSGLKDRNAITTQWFGVHLPKRDRFDWTEINEPGLKVLQQTWHRKKLRRGVHQINRFQITITNLSSPCDEITHRLEKIKATGVPNYFGEQRFGFDGQNLVHAEELLLKEKAVKKRHLRSMYLSSARSLLFNSVLSARVTQGNWNQAVEGDLMILEGTESFFPCDMEDETIKPRLDALNLHPSGPLWGKGGALPGTEVLAIEKKVLEDFQPICQALEKNDLSMQRRSLRLAVNDLHWEFSDQDQDALTLRFSLRRGGFATAVLKELVNLS